MIEVETTAEHEARGARRITDPFMPIAAGLLVLFIVGAAVLAF